MKYKCTKNILNFTFLSILLFSIFKFFIKRAVIEHPAGPLLDPQPVCLTPLI